MSSDESEEQIAFEQDQVLWAKIRGYPWWPAFVDKIQLHPKKQEAEYTVFFFGDNTHAKLGSSKLRKFIEFYTQNYVRAKTNRKLMISIQLAEQKLRQNDQDVEVFQQFRNSLKNKKHKQVGLVKTKSVKSQPNAFDSEDIPHELIKSKTNMSPNKRLMNSPKDSFKDAQDEENQIQGTLERRSSRRKSGSQQQDKNTDKVKKPVAQQIFQQEEQEQQQASKERKNRRKIILKNERIHAKQSEQQVGGNKHQQQFNEPAKSQDDSYYGRSTRRKASSKVMGPRRRGRPRKNADQYIESRSNKQSSRNVANNKKTKPIQKYEVHQKIETNHVLSLANQRIIKGVQEVLEDREELINYLEGIKITPQNAKEILDLNVSNILQNGIVNQRVKDLLNLLKSALLLRYFPEDIKNGKNYQKIAKKKQGSNALDNNKLQKSMELSQVSFDAEIRKKTLIKLEKFLKKNPEVEQNAKQVAMKIQRYFFRLDGEVGNRYKSMAYRILSSLKDNKANYKEIIQKLQKQGQND